MKHRGRIAVATLLVALFFVALGAAAIVVCVKVFHLSFQSAAMVGMPVSYLTGMLIIWILATRRPGGRG